MDPKEKENWIMELCGHYAKKLIFKKYVPEESNSLAVSLSSVCGDGRRTNTVCKALSEEDLIEPLHGWDKKAKFQVKHEVFLKIAPKYALAPEFDTSGWKSSSTSYFSTREDKRDPLESRYDKYKRLSAYGIKSENYIYIYFHQDEYVFVKRERSIGGKNLYYNSTRTVNETFIYPRAKLNVLEKNTFEAKLERAMKNHTAKVMDLVLEDKMEKINNETGTFKDTSSFDEHSPWRLENIQNRIKESQDFIRHYQQTLIDLKKIEAFMKPLGDENFLKKCKDVFRAHVIKMAPIYMNSKEEGDFKELAQLILKGSHEGIVKEDEDLMVKEEVACG